jgi:uncharacterized protein YaiI (UPF0178 family)
MLAYIVTSTTTVDNWGSTTHLLYVTENKNRAEEYIRNHIKKYNITNTNDYPTLHSVIMDKDLCWNVILADC